MTATHSTTTATTSRTTLQLIALAFGGAFLLTGLLGFVPGVTTEFGALELAGHDSEAKLLGLFQTSVLHNVVHLLFGVAGLVAARSITGAKSYLVGGGILYLGLMAFGFAIDQDNVVNFVPLNTADNWLHLGLGATMLAGGMLAGNRADVRTGAGAR